MADIGKKVEVRYGAFACTIEGYDDPVAELREVMTLMQRMINETPALADHSSDFDADRVRRVLADGDRAEQTHPGVVVIRSAPAEDAAPAPASEDAEIAEPAPEPANDAGDGIAPSAAAAVGAAVAAGAALAADHPRDDDDRAGDDDEHAGEDQSESETATDIVTGPDALADDDAAHLASDMPVEDDGAVPSPAFEGPLADASPGEVGDRGDGSDDAAPPVEMYDMEGPAPGQADEDAGAQPVEAAPGDPVVLHPDTNDAPAPGARDEGAASPLRPTTDDQDDDWAGFNLFADPDAEVTDAAESADHRQEPDDAADAVPFDAAPIAGSPEAAEAARVGPDASETARVNPEAPEAARFDPEAPETARVDADAPEAARAADMADAPLPAPDVESDFPDPADDRDVSMFNLFADPDAQVLPEPAGPDAEWAAPGDGTPPPEAAEPAGLDDATAPEPDPSPLARPEPAPSPLAPPDPLPSAIGPADPAAPDRATQDPAETAARRESMSGFRSLLQRVHGRSMMSAPGEGMPPRPEPEPARVDGADTLLPADFVARSGADTVADKLSASAAWLTLVQGRSRFTRREVMTIFEDLPGDHPRTLEARIKGFGKLVRSGTLILIDDGVFAMAQAERERYQSLLGGPF